MTKHIVKRPAAKSKPVAKRPSSGSKDVTLKQKRTAVMYDNGQCAVRKQEVEVKVTPKGATLKMKDSITKYKRKGNKKTKIANIVEEQEVIGREEMLDRISQRRHQTQPQLTFE